MNTLLLKLTHSFSKRRWFAGRYRLLRRLGAGGMAEVWLAERDDGRAVAIKRILPHLDEDSSVRLCFRDEARIGKAMKHAHLVRQLDYGYVGSAPFIVFEYVDGMSLRQLAERAHGAGTALPLGLCLRLTAEIAEALHHAHHAFGSDKRPLNLIHRDVSPDNILLDGHGAARLTDFGVARADCNQRVTANGSLCGKLAYMGPQQAAAERIDHRADQFSLAVVLFELLSRRRLLAERTPARTLGRILYTDLPDITEVTQGLPKDVAEAVGRALSRDPQQRFADCAEFAAALRRALERFESCEDESYEALLAHLLRQGGRTKPLPIAARAASPARTRRWVAAGDHTELAFVA